jgi:predicted ester cyclase
MADNKQTVRRMFDEVINLGKLELIDELFDPDFQSETAMGVLDREAFKGFVSGWRNGFSDLHCEVGDLVAEDDRVAWSIRAVGTHTGEFMGVPATGRSVDFDSLNIGQFRDGRGYRHKVMMDIPKMMMQLGQNPG